TDCTTAGLGLVYHGLRLREGQEFLVSEHNYYSTVESVRLASQRTGARVRQYPLYRQSADVGALRHRREAPAAPDGRRAGGDQPPSRSRRPRAALGRRGAWLRRGRRRRTYASTLPWRRSFPPAWSASTWKA